MQKMQKYMETKNRVAFSDAVKYFIVQKLEMSVGVKALL
jgi:hypothetical protein